MSSEEKPADTAAPAAALVDSPKETNADENTTAPEESTVGDAQVDGSGKPGNGDALHEVEYNVEVKLADLQADPNNPLYSAKSFEQLNLYARPLRVVHGPTFTDTSLIAP